MEAWLLIWSINVLTSTSLGMQGFSTMAACVVAGEKLKAIAPDNAKIKMQCTPKY